jgi:hypothetical protein
MDFRLQPAKRDKAIRSRGHEHDPAFGTHGASARAMAATKAVRVANSRLVRLLPFGEGPHGYPSFGKDFLRREATLPDRTMSPVPEVADAQAPGTAG